MLILRGAFGAYEWVADIIYVARCGQRSTTRTTLCVRRDQVQVLYSVRLSVPNKRPSLSTFQSSLMSY